MITTTIKIQKNNTIEIKEKLDDLNYNTKGSIVRCSSMKNEFPNKNEDSKVPFRGMITYEKSNKIIDVKKH